MSTASIVETRDPFWISYEKAFQAVHGVHHDFSEKQAHYFIAYQALRDAARMAPELDIAICGTRLWDTARMWANVLHELAFKGQMHIVDSKDEQRTREALSGFDFARVLSGAVPGVFHEIAGRKFSFLSIGLGAYEPTLACMSALYPELTSGGMVYLDDYGSSGFPGARKAVDEYLTKAHYQHLVRMPFASALIIK